MGTLTSTLILARGISEQRTGTPATTSCMCSCMSAFLWLCIHTCINLCVCVCVLVNVCMCVCVWMASGAINPGALMSQGELEMKVEMVMTPEGCRRQTSKNSRDSSAFIAYLSTLLFSFSIFFFFHEADCVCFFTSYRPVFPFCYRGVSFLTLRRNTWMKERFDCGVWCCFFAVVFKNRPSSFIIHLLGVKQLNLFKSGSSWNLREALFFLCDDWGDFKDFFKGVCPLVIEFGIDLLPNKTVSLTNACSYFLPANTELFFFF